MHCDIRDEFSSTEDVLDIKERVCRIYLEVAKDFFNFEAKDVLNEIKGIKCIKRLRKFKAKFSVKPPEFIYFGIEDVCFALQKFDASFVDYKEISKYLSFKNPVRINCQHGESIHSVLGVCIAMDEITGHYGFFNNSEQQQIHVTLKETRPFWRRFCSSIIRRINSCYKNIEIKLYFLRTYDEVIQKLSEADILVMTRFLSKFCHETLSLLLKGILKKMKELSILFYLDDYQHEYYHLLNVIISNTGTWIEIKQRETAYEDQERVEYFPECKVFPNIYFPPVIHSTFIKYSGSKIDNSKFKPSTETRKTNNFRRTLTSSNGRCKNLVMQSKSNAATLKKRSIKEEIECKKLPSKDLPKTKNFKDSKTQNIKNNRLPKKLEFLNRSKKNKYKKSCLIEYKLSLSGYDIENNDIEIQNDVNKEFSVEKEYIEHLEYFALNAGEFCCKASNKPVKKKEKKTTVSKKKSEEKINMVDVSFTENGSNKKNTGVLSEKEEQSLMIPKTKQNLSKKKIKNKLSKSAKY